MSYDSMIDLEIRITLNNHSSITKTTFQDKLHPPPWFSLAVVSASILVRFASE